jgi:hypothetical protein
MPGTLNSRGVDRHGLTAGAEQQRDRNRCALTVILPCSGLRLEWRGAVGLIAPTAGSAIVLGHDVVTGGGQPTGPLTSSAATVLLTDPLGVRSKLPICK